MRILKLTLIALLIVVTAAFCFTTFRQSITGTNVGPTITCDGEILEISVNDPASRLLTGVTAQDKQDGDLTGQVLIQSISKLLKDNTAKVTYLVFDSHGNMATCARHIRYTDYAAPQFAIRSALRYGYSEPIELLDRIRATDVLDGDITDAVRVSSLSATADPEIFSVTLQVTNSMGDTTRITLPILRESGNAARPQVELKEYLIYLNTGDSFRAEDYLSRVRLTDDTADLKNVEITGDVDTTQPGTYTVCYRYYHNATLGTALLTVVVEEGAGV